MANLSASPATSIMSKGFPRDPVQKSRFTCRTPAPSRRLCLRSSQKCRLGHRGRSGTRERLLGRRFVGCFSTAGEVGVVNEDESGKAGVGEGQDKYLLREFGWGVRRMAKVGEEMSKVAHVQAEAFHIPVALLNDLFFNMFKAEVLSALMYKVRSSPPERYACLVAESASAHNSLWEPLKEIVGVVDVTVQKDEDVLCHIQGEQEYLYISGIAVLTKFRRQKIATVLLKACDVLSALWGFSYLALRAHEDDFGARKLYSNAGYKVVSRDPIWITWIGRKQRVLMVKPSPFYKTGFI
ncbi:hypothetical protein OPV22_015199 [Ensete ventricosum]|uniref:N-acetyltransferase domain-containing protein n=1 Tax=Ensete ventricosum TaxID=4639 RepID=A0AAV8PLJ8_ENSVE|nr:hypothetical protein OPV22_015199 [Ensete ventricosum]